MPAEQITEVPVYADFAIPPPEDTSQKDLNKIRWTLLIAICVFNIFQKAPEQTGGIFQKESQKLTSFSLTELSLASNIGTICTIIVVAPLGALMDKIGISIPLTGVMLASMLSSILGLLNTNFFHSSIFMFVTSPIVAPVNTVYGIVLFKILLKWFEGRYFTIALVVSELAMGVGLIGGGYIGTFVYKLTGGSLFAVNCYQIIMLTVALITAIFIGRVEARFGIMAAKQIAVVEQEKCESAGLPKKKLKLPFIVIVLCAASVFIDSTENTVTGNETFFLSDKFDYTPTMIASVRTVTLLLEGVFSFLSMLVITKYGYQSTVYLFNALILCAATFWSAFIPPNLTQPIFPSIPLYLIQMGASVKTLAFKTMIPNVVGQKNIGKIFGTTGSVQCAMGSFLLSDGFSILHDNTTYNQDSYFWPLTFAGCFGTVGLCLVIVAILMNRFHDYGLNMPIEVKKIEVPEAEQELMKEVKILKNISDHSKDEPEYAYADQSCK